MTEYAQRMKYVKPSAIRDLLRLGADPAIISFGGGYPDASLFPTEQLSEIFQAALLQGGSQSLQYTVSNGTPELRAHIAERMCRQGSPCTAEEILILQGAQQGLDLVAKLLINPGNTIVTENPTFLGALIAFNPYEPTYQTVDIDQDGMSLEQLETVLQNNQVKFIYTIPDFQNPTGVTLSLERRHRLIELANRYKVLILEDTPYREIRYEGQDLPTLKSLDSENRVICLGSFSKILAPGLRLGWAVASEELIQQLGLLKLAADTQCSTLNMAATTLFLERCDLEAHIQTLRNAYRHKRTLMLETIRQTFPSNIAFTNPEGGLFTWLTFPEGFDAAQFMLEHALPTAKVAYVPGATFYPLQEEANHARINFSSQSDAMILKGMTALGDLLRKHI